MCAHQPSLPVVLSGLVIIAAGLPSGRNMSPLPRSLRPITSVTPLKYFNHFRCSLFSVSTWLSLKFFLLLRLDRLKVP